MRWLIVLVLALYLILFMPETIAQSCSFCNDMQCNEICETGETNDCLDCSPVCGDPYCGYGEDNPDHANYCPDDCGINSGSACFYDDECSGGYCVHGVCSNVPYIQGDGHCDWQQGESQENSEDCQKADGEYCESYKECAGGYCIDYFCSSYEGYCGDGMCDELHEDSTCDDCYFCDSGACCDTTTNTFMSSDTICNQKTLYSCVESDGVHYYNTTQYCSGTDADCTGNILTEDGYIWCDTGQICTTSPDGSEYQCSGCPDGDQDGYTDISCGGSDCNDDDANVNIHQYEICDDGIDNNCNGFVDCEDDDCACSCIDNDGDGYNVSDCGPADCDDNDPDIYPMYFYQDKDGDGLGNPYAKVLECGAVSGYVENSDDCDDSDSLILGPVMHYIDNDGDGMGSEPYGEYCPGTLDAAAIVTGDCDDDNASILDPVMHYVDQDGDGYGSSEYGLFCPNEVKEGLSSNDDDCDDSLAYIHPGAAEVCNGMDDDCSGEVDDGIICTEIPYFCDEDNDNVISHRPSGFCQQVDCSLPEGCSIEKGQDCDDSDDGIALPIIYFRDDDADGYGGPQNISVCSLAVPLGYADNTQDCNDKESAVNPSSEELCDGIDNNCDGDIDELVTCCQPGQSRSCERDPECPGVPGTAVCQDMTWGACTAECPVMHISSPRAKNYYTCDEMRIPVYYTPKESCTFNLDGREGAIYPEMRLLFELGSHELTITCENLQETVSFSILESDSCTRISQDDYEGIFLKEGINESEVRKANKTRDVVDHSIEYIQEENVTYFKSSLRPRQDVQNLSYALHIPKCLTPYLDDIEFDYADYEVIKEDPLIAWHFADADESIDITYSVDKNVDVQCLDQIKGMPIAEVIRKQEDLSLSNIILPVLIIALVVSIVIAMHHSPPKVLTEAEYKDKFIKSQYEKMCKEIQSLHPRSAEEAIKYMDLRGVSEEEKTYVLNRLGLK